MVLGPPVPVTCADELTGTAKNARKSELIALKKAKEGLLIEGHHNSRSDNVPNCLESYHRISIV
jgi:hypothetical protein